MGAAAVWWGLLLCVASTGSATTDSVTALTEKNATYTPHILVYGGWQGASTGGKITGVTAVEAIDLASQDHGWSTAKGLELAEARGALGYAAVGGVDAYAIGGADYEHSASDTVVASHHGDAWKPGPQLPFGAQGAAAVVLGEELFVFGGLQVNAGSTQVLSLKPKGAAWQTHAPMTQPRMFHAAVAFNNKAYVLGGVANFVTPATTDVQVFDGTAWTTGPPMTAARASAAAAVFLGKIYVAGGYSGSYQGNTVLASVESFDGTKWAAVLNLPTPTFGAAAVAHGAAMYILGGASPTKALAKSQHTPLGDDDQWVATNRVFQINGDNTVQPADHQLQVPRLYHAAILVNLPPGTPGGGGGGGGGGPGSSSKVGLAVGLSLGLLVVLAVAGLWLYRRRRYFMYSRL